MLSLHTARKPAPMLARGALWLGRRGGATAFGNAIGGSIASQFEPQAQGQGPWSDWGYVNGSDLQSDGYNPATEYGYRNGLDIDSDNFSAAMAYGYRNGMDVESDAASRASGNDEVRLPDGRYMLPSGRIVRPGGEWRYPDQSEGASGPVSKLSFAADVAQRKASNGYGLAELRYRSGIATQDDVKVLGSFPASQEIKSQLIAFAPSGLRKVDGSPVTYAFNERTGQAYWDTGENQVLKVIPKAFRQPTLGEAALADPNNPFALAGQAGPAIRDFMLLGIGGGAGAALAIPAIGLGIRGVMGVAADTSTYGLRTAYLMNANAVNTTGLVSAELGIGWNAVAPSPASLVAVGNAKATGPRLFHNLFPEDPIDVAKVVPNSRLNGISGNFNYVVLEDGALVVGKSGHTSLTGGAQVQAAGEIQLYSGGNVKWLDNASGHYQPTGSDIVGITEKAFGDAGLNVTGKFVDKIWVFDPTLPRGGKWIPRP